MHATHRVEVEAAAAGVAEVVAGAVEVAAGEEETLLPWEDHPQETQGAETTDSLDNPQMYSPETGPR